MFLLPTSYWKVLKTKQKGKGVFARRDIAPGIVIGDYIGKVVKSVEDDIFEDKLGFYLMYYSEYSTVVPDIDSNGIHLINHSCTPNLGMVTYKGHTIYFSLRKIFKGEEITVSYQLAPLDKDCNPCTHKCYCGSIVCSQTMHLSDRRYNLWDKFDTKMTRKTKRPRAKIGKLLDALSEYPQNIPDYAVYDLFGSTKKLAKRYPDTKLPQLLQLRNRIRQSGRNLRFDKINVTVYGIKDKHIITQPA